MNKSSSIYEHMYKGNNVFHSQTKTCRVFVPNLEEIREKERKGAIIFSKERVHDFSQKFISSRKITDKIWKFHYNRFKDVFEKDVFEYEYRLSLEDTYFFMGNKTWGNRFTRIIFRLESSEFDTRTFNVFGVVFEFEEHKDMFDFVIYLEYLWFSMDDCLKLRKMIYEDVCNIIMEL